MTLDLLFRSMLVDVVREVVRAELGSATQKTEFLTYAEAAQFAHVSVATLKRWVHDGRLRAFGEGRVRRVKTEDVRACVEGRSKPVANAATVNEKVLSILSSVRGSR